MFVWIWQKYFIEQWFKYHGCYTSNWSRKHTRDVPISENGVFTCRDYCQSAGFNFFGLECPMGTKVHCECSNTLTRTQAVDDMMCQKFNTKSGHHCVGPFRVFTTFGTYFMGAGSLNSAYAVHPHFWGILWQTLIRHKHLRTWKFTHHIIWMFSVF